MTDSSPAGQYSVRRHNTALALGAIAANPGISRAGIATRTGLAKATVSTSIDRLVAANLVADTGPENRSGRGRRGTGLTLSPSGPHGLGVEIGLDYIATCLVDLTGDVHAHRVRPGENRAQSMRQVLARTARAMRTGLRDAEAKGVAVGGVGIAVPGLVDNSGLLRVGPNLGWDNADVRAELISRGELGSTPVLLGNEANLAATAELARTGLRDFLYVSGEVGIGSGLVVDGELARGVHGFSGEIGHICVDPNGPRCGCGAHGCLETLAGPPAIARRAAISTTGRTAADLTGALLDRLAAEDPAAVEAVREAGAALGIALAAVINIVDISTVVLGASYAALQPWLDAPLRTELDTRVVSARWTPPAIQPSALGPEAAVLGAATAAINHILTNPESTPRPNTP